jgi:hypothetical protein
MLAAPRQRKLDDSPVEFGIIVDGEAIGLASEKQQPNEGKLQETKTTPKSTAAKEMQDLVKRAIRLIT